MTTSQAQSSSTLDPLFLNHLQKKMPGLKDQSVRAVLKLQAEGATVPFIARYRKEQTLNLDEVQVRDILDEHETWSEMLKRKEFILKEIGEQGNLTDELKARLTASMSLTELEEIYRPFKRKKKTKATIAREAGLGPFADWIWQVGHGEVEPDQTLEVKAKSFIAPAKGFAMYEEVLQGAQNILVEKVSNDPDLRSQVREELLERGKVISVKSKDFKPKSKFSMYGEFSEAVKSLETPKASHRYLALRRGWSEGELKVSVEGDQELLLKKFENFSTTIEKPPFSTFLKDCAKAALNTHVMPSITNEIHASLKEKADLAAIQVFADNVKRVLMGSPFGPQVVLGIDPGLRTGCKMALIDQGGNFISHTVLQILGDSAVEKARALFREVFQQIQIKAVAVGNGTGGREAQAFIKKLLAELKIEAPVIMVSESGASIYSASEVARSEFPDLDLTIRGAISIARRLQDPLSELVKLEPKSIGVGQYQHDVNQSRLKKSLNYVVESCVNGVGVDVNTASPSLLQYVAGIGPATAKNIVAYRKEKGLFKERSEFLKVPQFSSKTFEQAGGFLRIPMAQSPLDRTGIHPERYSAVQEMAADLKMSVSQLMAEGLEKLKAQKEKWSKLVGEFTFGDIISELEKPGRDPRDPFKTFDYRNDIHEVKDLKEGLICPGLVTNVTNFGAFVDVGVHQDGLVHISELADQFVDDPQKVVSPGDQVQVRVLAVDLEKNQISFSMKLDPKAKPQVASTGQRKSARSKDSRKEGGASARSSNSKRPRSGDRKGKGRGQSGGSSSAPRKPRFEKKPFNNPFAALTGIKE